MTVRHHLSDTLLMSYAAGELPEAFALVVATHISMCDECRATLAGFEAVGGAVLDGAETVAMGDHCLEATLARLGVREAPTPAPRNTLPAPLADYIGGDLSQVKWRSIGMGVRQALLPTTGEGLQLRGLQAEAKAPGQLR